MRKLAGLVVSLAIMTQGVFGATITGYCPCVACCGPTPDVSKTFPGLSCAGPRALEKGSIVYIEDVGFRVVTDRTHIKYDGRFDVCFQTHREALKQGKSLNQTVLLIWSPSGGYTLSVPVAVTQDGNIRVNAVRALIYTQ